MPVYEYECEKCEKCCEILVRSGEPKPRCPSCDSPKLKKVFSAPSIIMKGGSSSSSSKASSSSKSSCSRSSCSGCHGCH